MNLSFKKVIACLLVCVAIAVFPLLTNHTSDFGGSDDAADDLLRRRPSHTGGIRPLYKMVLSVLYCSCGFRIRRAGPAEVSEF